MSSLCGVITRDPAMDNKSEWGVKVMDRRTWMGATLAGVSAGLCAGSLPARESLQDEDQGWIDSHVHVWTNQFDRYPIVPPFRPEEMEPRTFEPEVLLGHARPAGVSRIVLVQMSYYGADNRYMLDVMQEHPGTFGGIGIVDQAKKPVEAMQELKGQGVRGFRIQPHDAKPDRWLSDEASRAMWTCANDENLAMCALIDPPFLASLERELRLRPKTPVVIDHFARIGIGGTVRESDLESLLKLADYEQVHVKVSAYYALGAKRAPYVDLLPMIDKVVGAYGAERCMWGSDAPYQVMEGHTYADSIALITDRWEATEETKNWLLRGTAEKLFF